MSTDRIRSQIRSAPTLDALQDVISGAMERGDPWGPELDALMIQREEEIIARESAEQAAADDRERDKWQEEADRLTAAESIPDSPAYFLVHILAIPAKHELRRNSEITHIVVGRPYERADPVCALGVHSWDLSYSADGGPEMIVNSDEPGEVGTESDIPGWGELRSAKVWGIKLPEGTRRLDVKVRGVTMATDPWTRGEWSDVHSLVESVVYTTPGDAFPLVGQLPQQGWRGLQDPFFECMPVDPGSDPEYRTQGGF